MEIVLPSEFNLDSSSENWFSNAYFCQSQAWINCVGSESESCYVTKENNQVIAYSFVRNRKLPFSFGSILVIERGPVAKDLKSLALHLKEISQGKGIVQVEISPYNTHFKTEEIESLLEQEGWHKRAYQRAIYTHSVIVDLRQDKDAIRKNFRRSLKTQINKALKLGIDIQLNTSVADSISFYNEFAKKRSILEISSHEKKFILQEIGSKVQVLSAKKDNILIGAIFLVDMGVNILYQWGVSHDDEGYRKLPVTHLLHWEGILLAKKLDYQSYDFGGYWAKLGDSNSNNRFKTGFSKNVVRFIGEHFFRVRYFRSLIYEFVIRRRNAK